jgi:E3 ubiquitin-protein ligase BRE1
VVRHMKAESETRTQLIHANERLQKYESTYGTLSNLPPDVQRLEEQLRVKEDELQRLRLIDIQRAQVRDTFTHWPERQELTNCSQAETSLYSELDKLSAAWEALDRQVKSKVFDLGAMEERLTKSGLDVCAPPTQPHHSQTNRTQNREQSQRTSFTQLCGIKKPSRPSGRTFRETWKSKRR